MEDDPIAAYLDALARDSCYRVAQVLKTAPHESTELVVFVGANASELGPFVRKRISMDTAMGEAYRYMFMAQRAGRRFRHLPQIYDVHESDKSLVVVMEYVKGHTLREEVYERDGSLDLAVRWFPLLCDGVMELHEQFPTPLIHRDLKPSNVLVSKEGLTIIDFGIARAFREGAESDTTHFGTRSYAPPEQFGYGQTDVRSDVYALGMVLYYLLTERDPSPAVITTGFADSEVPKALRPVLCRACAFDPAFRFQTVRELKEGFCAAAKPLLESSTAQSSGAKTVSVMGGAAGSAPSRLAGPASAQSPDSCLPGSSNSADAIPSVALSDSHRLLGCFVERVREAFATLTRTEIVGLVWDGMLGAAWMLFIAVCAVIPFGSLEEPYSAWPAWMATMLYWGFGYPFFTGFLLVLADVRVVRRIVPRMRTLKGRRLRVLGVVLIAVGVLVVFMVMIIAQALGYPTV